VRDGQQRPRPAQAGYTSNDVKVRRQNTWRFLPPRGRAAWRDTRVVIPRAAMAPGREHEVWDRSPLQRRCLCPRPLPGAAFMMRSPAHASTSKLTRGLINAAIGSWRTPWTRSTPYAALSCNMVAERKNFLIIEHWLSCDPCILSTIFLFRALKYPNVSTLN